MKMFHPSVPNPEALDRTTVATLVPSPSSPKLRAPNDDNTAAGPYVTVVAHDPDAFAEEGLKMNGTPKALNDKYVQPAWDEHNDGLLKLVEDKDRVRGVVIAKGAGHFVQRDNAECVAEEIVGLVIKIAAGSM